MTLANPQNFRIAWSMTAVFALLWLGLVVDWMAFDFLPPWLYLAGFSAAVVVSGAWIWASRRQSLLYRAVVYSLAYVPCWTFSVVGADYLVWDGMRSNLAQTGLGGLYLIGLGWVVWALERLTVHYENRRAQERDSAKEESAVTAHSILLEGHSEQVVYNPLDPAAWYYGRRGKKLNQSISVLMSYSGLFTLIVMLLSHVRGCEELYEMPAGGGKPQMVAQTVKIKKVIKKKFVINPFSSVIFNPPPIDEVKLQLQEATAHLYAVGYGQGDGAGFAGGTPRGKVRFIRLEYAGGDWDQDFGVGADLNMLTEYGIRTKQKINTETESRAISQLRNFPIGKSPPFVYMTGQRSISISESERKILREYLLDKHGMIFCDNGGSRHFHNQFVAMMNYVLEGKVEPVAVPLDDPIHSVPYRIPFLPYVAPHGGKEALGWKVDGRWVAYYSPGDIADAWSDGHAGVKPEVWEYCFQLGTNVIFYAHLEYNKWLDARSKK
ncbi:MAG: hypothetical protein JWM11_4158 [Planctomycetaceae bacterium]|nr:hypothetical protein [Planctomycetaceae bacterium]